ncbi:MAG: hypothetical protein J1E65_05735 [Lachnospiraceae bacterium]|nr:hypothetical protein [Lachnospiraceae bacterium]
MGENSNFDFCPKCGAVAKDGVCQSCGYQNPDAQQVGQAQQAGQAQDYYTQQSGYYSGQSDPAQNYYAQQAGQPGQAQGYYSSQAAQTQNYYAQQTGQPGQTQGYYSSQPGQAQNYYTQQAGQPGQAQGYYSAQPGQAQNYYTQQAGQPGQAQNYYGQQPGYYSGQPNLAGQPYGGYPGAIPPETGNGTTKKGTTVLLCVILGIVLLAVVILILVALYHLQESGKKNSRSDRDRDREEEMSEVFTEDETEPEESKPEDDDVVDNGQISAYDFAYEYSSQDVTLDNWYEEGQNPSLPYYTGPYNALRDDLSYEINFIQETFQAVDTDVLIYISSEYPQIVSEDIPYVDWINENLRDEYLFYYNTFEDRFKPLVKSEDDLYYCVVDSYVTYMDEDLLSIVFKETIFLNLKDDPFQDLCFYCVNINLQTGQPMDNTQILKVDENLVASLREKELIENESLILDTFTDEEIMDMLMDDGDLVLFYTPMGMEVGVNLGNRVIYFMYDDYVQYLNTF